MKFIAKETTREPSLDIIVELAQDENDVNIKLNQRVVAWFDAYNKKLYINAPDLKDLGLTVTVTR